MFSFVRGHQSQKDSELDEQTPLLLKHTEPLLAQLVQEQKCQTRLYTSTAAISFLCSFISLVWLILLSRHNQQHSNESLHQDDDMSSGNTPTASTHNHWSVWISALTSCLVVSPFVVLSQRKLVLMESRQQTAQLLNQEAEGLLQEHAVLQKQVQMTQDAVAP